MSWGPIQSGVTFKRSPICIILILGDEGEVREMSAALGIRLEDVMHTSLPLLGADQILMKAAEVMLANKTLGVVTADVKRRPMLVLSYRKLVRAIARGANPKDRITLYAVDEPVVAHKDLPVIDALELMKREAIRFLPVVDSRNKLVGVFEPYYAAQTLWDYLEYGDAQIEPRLRKLVALPASATIRVAAKAMDDNGVPEILVRYDEGEHRILREEDFLRAVAEGRVDDGTVGEYAKGKVVRVPPHFDAKSAVDLMLENSVRRLVVDLAEPRRQTVITLTDLAFEAGQILARRVPKEVGFVLVKTDVGRELELAQKLIMVDGVTEVHTVTGDYDVLVKVEAPSLRDIYKIVREKIRSMPGVTETKTLAGVRVVAKQEP